MAQYWYKKDKRVLRVDDNLSTDKQKELKDNGYVQVSDRRNPEKFNIDRKLSWLISLWLLDKLIMLLMFLFLR